MWTPLGQVKWSDISEWVLGLSERIKKIFSRTWEQIKETLTDAKEAIMKNQDLADKAKVALLLATCVIVGIIIVMWAGEVAKEIPYGKIGLGILGAILLVILWKTAKSASVKGALGKATDGFQVPFGDIFVALIIFVGFNGALYAAMSSLGGAQGKEHFLGTWIWSPTFWLIGLIAVAKAFPSQKGNRFGFLAVPIALFAFVSTLVSVWPGFFPGQGTKNTLAAQTPTHSDTRDMRPVARIVGEPNMLTFDPADSLPNVTAELIERHFKDFGDSVTRTMKRIAWAESRGKHWETDKGEDTITVLRGKNPGKPDDVGLFQIHEGGTAQDCLKAGYDYLTLEGNLECAVFLYDRRGFNDWSASAWSWRDNYESRPENWSFDRTPRQIVAASRGEDEIIIVTAPNDSSWSDPIHSYGRRFSWSDLVGGHPWEVEDDQGNRYKVDGHNNETILKRYPVWVRIRSLSETNVTVVFTRSNPR